MEWVSLIISIFALLLSALIFIKYDKKIKEQNIIINQYRLQQIEEEKQKNKSAKISGSIVRESIRDRKLVITNEGPATARNICITDIRSIRGINQTGGWVFPYGFLKPGRNIEVPFMLSDDYVIEKIELKYTWEDEYRKDNFYEQTLQL